MNGLSFSATTEKRKGILLDPRTKLILLLTITTLMFSTSNEGIMNIVKPCLSLVPFALILSERRFKTAGKYLVLYAVCFILERIALTSLSGLSLHCAVIWERLFSPIFQQSFPTRRPITRCAICERISPQSWPASRWGRF